MTPDQLANLRSRGSRPRRTTPIVLNGEIREQIERLDAELEAEERRGIPATTDTRLGSRRAADPARVAELEEQLAALHDQAAGETLHVVVEGLAGTPWRTLLAAHPPVEGNKDHADFGADQDTIRDPLLQASIIGYRSEPDSKDVSPFAEGYVDWLLGWVTDRQKDLLVIDALAVSRGDATVPLRRRPSQTRLSGAG